MNAKRATKTRPSAPAQAVPPSRLTRALEASLRGEAEVPPPLVAPPLPGLRPRVVPVVLTPEVPGPASWTAELKLPRGARVLGVRYLSMRSLARGAWRLRVAVLVSDPDVAPVTLPIAVVREGDDATLALTMNYVSDFDVDGTYFHVFIGRST